MMSKQLGLDAHVFCRCPLDCDIFLKLSNAPNCYFVSHLYDRGFYHGWEFAKARPEPDLLSSHRNCSLSLLSYPMHEIYQLSQTKLDAWNWILALWVFDFETFSTGTSANSQGVWDEGEDNSTCTWRSGNVFVISEWAQAFSWLIATKQIPGRPGQPGIAHTNFTPTRQKQQDHWIDASRDVIWQHKFLRWTASLLVVLC